MKGCKKYYLFFISIWADMFCRIDMNHSTLAILFHRKRGLKIFLSWLTMFSHPYTILRQSQGWCSMETKVRGMFYYPMGTTDTHWPIVWKEKIALKPIFWPQNGCCIFNVDNSCCFLQNFSIHRPKNLRWVSFGRYFVVEHWKKEKKTLWSPPRLVKGAQKQPE